jgi:hypothetical protein
MVAGSFLTEPSEKETRAIVLRLYARLLSSLLPNHGSVNSSEATFSIAHPSQDTRKAIDEKIIFVHCSSFPKQRGFVNASFFISVNLLIIYILDMLKFYS